jgi:hypothetical protein
VLLGVILRLLIVNAHQPVLRNLQTAQAEERELSTQEATLIANQQQHQNLVETIRSQHVPWTRVLYHLGEAILPGVGITKLDTEGEERLILSAQARDARLVHAFWDKLNASPFFVGANVPTIREEPGVTTFQMSITLPKPPPLPPAPTDLNGLINLNVPPTAFVAPAASVFAPTAAATRGAR